MQRQRIQGLAATALVGWLVSCGSSESQSKGSSPGGESTTVIPSSFKNSVTEAELASKAAEAGKVLTQTAEALDFGAQTLPNGFSLAADGSLSEPDLDSIKVGGGCDEALDSLGAKYVDSLREFKTYVEGLAAGKAPGTGMSKVTPTDERTAVKYHGQVDSFGKGESSIAAGADGDNVILIVSGSLTFTGGEGKGVGSGQMSTTISAEMLANIPTQTFKVAQNSQFTFGEQGNVKASGTLTIVGGDSPKVEETFAMSGSVSGQTFQLSGNFSAEKSAADVLVLKGGWESPQHGKKSFRLELTRKSSKSCEVTALTK